MFAETVIVDFRLTFAEQGKQTSVFLFHLRQINGSLLFPFSICSKQTEVAVFRQFRFHLRNSGNMETWRRGDMEPWRHRHGDMETWTWRYGIIILGNSDILKGNKKNRKRKPRRFSLICLPVALRENGS